jgi:hypothetical protein
MKEIILLANPVHGVIQPPTFADEHRSTPGPEQLKSKDRIVVAFGLIPRSIHISLQPRRHVIDVGPAGASTTNSKSGSDI